MSYPLCCQSKIRGFTLAELLIALAILGVIATFTIPKVLQASSDAQFNAAGKEVAGMISGAYQAYQVRNTPVATTTIADLTPYMNYVSLQTTGQIDYVQNNATPYPCVTASPCLVLHNGGRLFYDPGVYFNGTGNNAVWFYFDPDGRVTDGTASGPGHSVLFALYFNGRIRTWATVEAGTQCSSGCGGGLSPSPVNEPPWFHWT